MGKFWLYATSAYGTLWGITMFIAVVTQSHINTGLVGMYGFPIVAFIYGYTRRDMKTPEEAKYKQIQQENDQLKERIALYEAMRRSD